ncbi:MAG TPA: hypothetical protein VE078_03650 [Thermoanaerobaculia bacterium]|nr:hypothetical protein [Thermoanaerobaculia bacterium]
MGSQAVTPPARSASSTSSGRAKRGLAMRSLLISAQLPVRQMDTSGVLMAMKSAEPPWHLPALH